MEEEIDLFQNYQGLPLAVLEIIDKYCSEGDQLSYTECEQFEAELKPLGYIFDWGLSGEPHNLRKIK